MLWSADDLHRALGIALSEMPAGLEINGLSIDSRTLQAGDLFIALKAARDGHDFVAQALQKGAAAALVSRKMPGEGVQIVVPDTLKALEQMGQFARNRGRARHFAVTGSMGKTGTKTFLVALLETGNARVHAAEGSYNNHWGVPLTLARMPAETDFAVFELGMNAPGEIAPLARQVKPEVAIITSIAPVHLAAFENIRGIAAEKFSILQGVAEGGTLVCPQEVAQTYADLIPPHIHVQTLGENGQARLLEFHPEGVRAEVAGAELSFTLSLPGRHHAHNALLALLACHQVGVDVVQAAKNLHKVTALPGRGQVFELNGIRLVDDSYNANPGSVMAALRTLTDLPVTGHRVAILGDMLELGENAVDFHAGLAAACADIDQVVTIGPLMKHLYETLPAEKRLAHFNAANEIDYADLARAFQKGDVIWVKGSKGTTWVTGVAAKIREAIEKKKERND